MTTTLIIAMGVLCLATGWTVSRITSGRRTRRRLKRAGDKLEQQLVELLPKGPPSPPRVVDWAGMPIITSDMVPPGQIVIVSSEWMSSPGLREFLGDDPDPDRKR